MRKKLMISIFSTVLLSLVLITILYIFIVDYEFEQMTKRTLKNTNQNIINLITSGNIANSDTYFKENFKNCNVRVTYIDKDGKVISDSEADPNTMDNHNSREEVKEARKDGTGTSIRYSSSVKENMMYYATTFRDGQVIRSSMTMKYITGFEKGYLKYYFLILILVFGISIFISFRLVVYMLRPIKELEVVTSEVAKGDLNKRVRINSKDEISELGKTFNEMADKLQITINTSLEQQNRLEAILTSMDSGIIAIDKNKKIIMTNPYAEKIFGLYFNVIGANLLDIIRNHELEDVLLHKDYNDEDATTINFRDKVLRIRTADIINGGEVMGTVAVIQDITDIRKLEKMRSQFVANVSHELKTPLTSIKGFAETLKDVEDQKTKEKFLNIIDQEAERLTRLINDILTLSDIEQHKDAKVEDVNVKEVIEDVYYLMKNTAVAKNISLNIIENQDVIIVGDSDKFKQMLINLVDNAIKYSDMGDSVFINSIIEEGKCILTIEDTGPGIPEKHIPRLFERFYRVDEARSRAKGGTGLGLAIVKHIVLSFGGEIQIKSIFGEGSKFIIKIPVKNK